MPNHRDLEQLLESDDEFPMNFDEIPEMPAYQDNNRFDFKGKECETSDEFDDDDNYSNSSHPSLEQTIEEIKNDIINSKNKIIMEDKHIQKGILNRQDVVCLSSIANVTAKTTLMWLLNFLLHKDMQTKFKFLRSCLVNDIVTSNYENAIFDTSEKNEQDNEIQYFEIVYA